MDKQKIVILTDSACNVSNKVVKKYNIKIIPLRLCFSNKTYLDRFEITAKEFFEKLEKEIPKSSLPAFKDVIKKFNEIKEQEYTDVIYIGMSSALSGTYNFINIIGREFKDINFYSFDTKTLSCGQEVLVVEAAKMFKAGKSVKEIINRMRCIRDNTVALFVVEDLTYLRKGGRIGKVAGTVGTLLNINPVITVNKEGEYETVSKTIGFGRAIDLLVKEIKKRFLNQSVNISIVVGKDREKANVVLRKLKVFMNVTDCSINTITHVLGIHTGPNILGLAVYPSF